jgi:hypothetical protein
MNAAPAAAPVTSMDANTSRPDWSVKAMPVRPYRSAEQSRIGA